MDWAERGVCGESSLRRRAVIARRLCLTLAVGMALLCVACVGEKKSEGPPPKKASRAEAPKRPRADRLELVFVYGSEKEEWIKEATAAFNSERKKTKSGKMIHVKAIPMGSGETVDSILAGRLKAHVISPASAAFIKLGNAESQRRAGTDLVGRTDNLVLSPVVIAMWKPMAEAIGWGEKPIGWSDIIALADDPKGWETYGKPQWGRFKFGHTHPEHSNSGLISLFAEVYAGAGKVAGLTVEDVNDPKVAEYLSKIEKAVVHYGSSTGFFGKKMFARGPSYLSAAVLYENMVIESYSDRYQLPFPVVAIYPKEGTFWSDHPAGVVERDWVTPEHREAGRMYIDYLLEKPQQEKALKYGFRPASVDVPLAAPLDAAHGVDPKEPKTTLEVPSVPVMDAIIKLWHENKKHTEVVLVIDISGSMKRQDKMTHAKKGAEQMVKMLGDRDRFSLMPFNHQAAWALQDASVKEKRQEALQEIGKLWADGGTALYDSVAMAYDYLSQRWNPGRIFGVVALTDGKDEHSAMNLPQLIEKISAEREGPSIRIFTIAYGKGAEMEVLEQISEATQAKAYKGTPQNIRQVFKEISTFF